MTIAWRQDALSTERVRGQRGRGGWDPGPQEWQAGSYPQSAVVARAGVVYVAVLATIQEPPDSEWLVLNGPQGVTGENGPQGPGRPGESYRKAGEYTAAYLDGPSTLYEGQNARMVNMPVQGRWSSATPDGTKLLYGAAGTIPNINEVALRFYVNNVAVLSRNFTAWANASWLMRGMAVKTPYSMRAWTTLAVVAANSSPVIDDVHNLGPWDNINLDTGDGILVWGQSYAAPSSTPAIRCWGVYGIVVPPA